MSIFKKKPSNDSANGKPGENSTSNSVKEFLSESIFGNVKKQIKISELSDYCIAVILGNEAQEKLDPREIESGKTLISEHLSGTCTKCGVPIKGNAIWIITLMKLGYAPLPRVEQTENPMERILNGKCYFEKCDSGEMIIEWRV